MPTLTANATGASYQWVNCNTGYSIIAGATSQSYMASANGSYAVIVTQNGCTDTSVCQTVGNVGVEENNFENQLEVYPNPTQRNITVNLGNTYNKVLVTITNVLGQEVLRKNLNATHIFDLDIQGEPGVYLINITINADKKAQLRVIKE